MYSLSKQDVDAYLATKSDEEVIGITCHARACLFACVAAWKYKEEVEVHSWTVHFANGETLLLEAELERMYHAFDALNRGEIERPVTKREWVEREG